MRDKQGEPAMLEKARGGVGVLGGGQRATSNQLVV